jgi:hypothetical protein
VTPKKLKLLKSPTKIEEIQQNFMVTATGVPRGGVWGVQTPPKFLSFEKAGPNSQFRGIYICNNLIRIWVSLIYN